MATSGCGGVQPRPNDQRRRRMQRLKVCRAVTHGLSAGRHFVLFASFVAFASPIARRPRGGPTSHHDFHRTRETHPRARPPVPRDAARNRARGALAQGLADNGSSRSGAISPPPGGGGGPEGASTAHSRSFARQGVPRLRPILGRRPDLDLNPALPPRSIAWPEGLSCKARAPQTHEPPILKSYQNRSEGSRTKYEHQCRDGASASRSSATPSTLSSP
jgi:hypothetical protein